MSRTASHIKRADSHRRRWIARGCLTFFVFGSVLGPGSGSVSRRAYAQPSAPPSTTNASEKSEFRSAILEINGVDEEQMRAELRLRLPKLDVRSWNLDAEPLASPFVLIRLTPDSEQSRYHLSLLTNSGRMYQRHIEAPAEASAREAELARSIVSFILAVQEGLIAPSAESVPLPEHMRATANPPVEATPEPQPVEDQPAAIPPKTSRWSLGFEISPQLIVGPPPPKFDVHFSGAGSGLSILGIHDSGFLFGGDFRFILVRKGERDASVQIRRVRLALLAGTTIGNNRFSYVPTARVSIEPWTARFDDETSPIVDPDGRGQDTRVLFGLGVEQRVFWNLRPDRQSPLRFSVGPMIGLGYGGIWGRGFAAAGIFAVDERANETPVARVGGFEIDLGLSFRLSWTPRPNER